MNRPGLFLISGILGPTNEGTQGLLNIIERFLGARCRVQLLALVSRRDARHTIDPLLLNRQCMLGIFTWFYPYKRLCRPILFLDRFRAEVALVNLAGGWRGGALEKALCGLIEGRGLFMQGTWLATVACGRVQANCKARDVVLVLDDCAVNENQVLKCVHLGIPLAPADDGVDFLLFGSCPFARFVRVADLLRPSWHDVEAATVRQGSSYPSRPFDARRTACNWRPHESGVRRSRSAYRDFLET